MVKLCEVELVWLKKFVLKSGYDDNLLFINIYKAIIVATFLLPGKCIWLQDCCMEVHLAT